MITLMILAIACNKQSDQDKLAKLQQQRQELDIQIHKLESQINKNDTSVAKPVPIAVTPVVLKRFAKYVILQGKVDARHNVIAGPQSPGIVTRLLVQNGQHVTKGQTLAILDDNVLGQQTAELDQQISFAKNIYDRQKSLWDQNIGTEVQLLNAKNNYESLLKKKNTINSQRSLYRIIAPLSGVVDNVIIKVGEMASPGAPNGIRIVSDKDLKVLCQIGESYISAINSGDPALVRFPDLHDTINSKIVYVSKTVDPVSRAFETELSLPYSPKYKPNMTAEIQIASYVNPRAISVPAGLVQHTPDGDIVMVMRKNQVKKAMVKIGQTYNGEVEILDGIMLDDQIITNGYDGLIESDKVTIVK